MMWTTAEYLCLARRSEDGGVVAMGTKGNTYLMKHWCACVLRLKGGSKAWIPTGVVVSHSGCNVADGVDCGHTRQCL